MFKLLLNKKVRALPFRFKLFIFRHYFSLGRSDNLQKIEGKKVLSIYLPLFPSEAFDTFLDAQIKASKGKPVPEIVNISLTSGCENNCWHCNTPGEREDLDTEVVLDAIEGLKELGTFQFLFTGGNPLLRDDLEELIRATGDPSIALVSTPGLVDEERAKSLKEAGCQGVLVALEHHGEEKNDRTMGCEGAHRRSLKSIENVREAGMLTGSWIVVTSEKISDLDRYLRYVKKKGVTDVAIFEPILSEKDKMLEEDEREYLKEIQKVARKRKDYPRIISGPFMDSEEFMGCTAGYNRIHISERGEVFPCDMLREEWGNIYEDDIKEIWNEMNSEYSEPICGCLALNNTEDKLPDYYRKLIRK
ncbi:MAG: radical SAM/SPASM domain-containing protein [Candidatus Aenigmatarchaeota archaeon]